MVIIMKKIIVVCTLALLSFTLLSCSTKQPAAFSKISSKHQLLSIISKVEKKQKQSYVNFNSNRVPAFNDIAQSDEALEFTQTNNQIATIDEADSLKTNGDYTFFIYDNVLHVYQTNPNQPIKKVVTLNLTNDDFINYTHLLLYNNELLVFGHESFIGFVDDVGYRNDPGVSEGSETGESKPQDFDELPPSLEQPVGLDSMPFNNDMAMIYLFPQQQTMLHYSFDNESLTLQNSYSIEGYYVGARLYNDQIILVTNKLNDVMAYKEQATKNALDYLPNTTLNQQPIEKNIRDVYVNDPVSTQMMSITRYNLSNYSIDTMHYMNRVDAMLITDETLFTATNDYNDSNTSTITSFDLRSLTPLHSVQVMGTLLNSFAMDYYDGYLRLAITKVQHGISNNELLIVNKQLSVVSSYDNLAKEERIYSIRFKKEKAYIVTFKEVDPFFVFDLSDPYSPKLLSELKVPGFSNYLHDIDQDTVLGFGYDVEIEDEFVRQTYLKVSLFDVSDPNNTSEADTYVVDNHYAYSDVMVDHKALLVDYNNKRIGFSYHTYAMDDGRSDVVVSSDYFMTYVLLGVNNHTITPLYTQQTTQNQVFVRSLIINDTLLIFSSVDLSIIDLSSYSINFIIHF